MAYADLYNPANVKVGNALGWYAPWVSGAVETLPANSVALWGDWAGTWEKAGATEESYQLNVADNIASHMIEEQPTAAFVSLETRDFSVTASLAEDTLNTLALTWGGDIATAVNVDTFTFSPDIKLWTFGLEMANLNGFARRLYIPKATVTSGGATAFRRSASKRLYPLVITPICKPEEIVIAETKIVA